MDAVRPRPHVVGRLGWHRLRVARRPDEAICGRPAIRHVCHAVVGGGLMVFGVGTHSGAGRHGLRGSSPVERRPSRTWHPFDPARHLHTPGPHEAHLDVCPRRDQCVVGGLRRLRWTRGPCHASRCGLGFRSGLPNPQTFPSPVVVDRMRSRGVFGGHVQGPGRRHRRAWCPSCSPRWRRC